MGLAGRKQKQRIPADPRNLTWADDASRFGQAYLSKFGWDASQGLGLGPSGDGMKTHLKVQQKLDMMGIGAQHQRDPNGIAWKQNKEFEALLKRLNKSAEQGEDEKEQKRVTEISKAFVCAREPEEDDEGRSENESSVTTKKRRKEGRDDLETGEDARKKRKKEKRKKSASSTDDVGAPATINPASEPPSAPSSSEARPALIPKPRPMAHRARIRAAKSIAGKSASAISEILGIAPSSTSASTSETPTPSPTPTDPPLFSLNTLTTSTKSVADYFKEKLVARSSSSSLTPSGSATPGLGAGLSTIYSPNDEDDELPRRGIGSRAPPVSTVVIDAMTEKQRRKEERRVEKRKRRAAKAEAQGVSTTDVKELEEEKKERKKRKRREREQQHAPAADQPNDNDDCDDDTRVIEKKPSGERDTQGVNPDKKPTSKKEHKKKRS